MYYEDDDFDIIESSVSYFDGDEEITETEDKEETEESDECEEEFFRKNETYDEETTLFAPVHMLSSEKIEMLQNDMKSENKRVVYNAKNETANAFAPLVKSVIAKYYSPYAKSYYEEMYQTGQCAVWIHFNEYDPACSAPTTFFRTHIIHEIQTFISGFISQTTRYYNDVVKKIKAAKQHFLKLGYEEHEITPTILATYTECPLVSIKEALKTMDFASQVPYDPNLSEVSDDYNPELAYEKAEETRMLDSALDRLSKEERLVFESLALETAKKAELANRLNTKIPKIDELYSNAVRKMRGDRDLSQMAGRPEKVKRKTTGESIPILRLRQGGREFFSDDIEEIPIHIGSLD